MLKVKFNTPAQYGGREFAAGVVYELEKNELPPRPERYEIVGKAQEPKAKAKPKVKEVKKPSKAQTKAMKGSEIRNTAMQNDQVQTKSVEAGQDEDNKPQDETTQTQQGGEGTQDATEQKE